MAPWDLADQPAGWTHVALAAQQAEQAAEAHQRELARRRQ